MANGVLGWIADVVANGRDLDDASALDRIATVFVVGLPDGLRASTDALEEVQRLVRLTGRDAGPQFEEGGKE